MLKQLTIKNLAIIDDITIDFQNNLNVLSGETGAGKSIIIDAISLIFGERANSEIIAYGQEFAYISVSLEINKKLIDYILKNYDIDVSEEFIISRTISSNNKNSLKINGMMVPLKVVKEISELLIDISSQNESQYLLNHKNHLNLLDTFILNQKNDFLNNYKIAYDEYKKVKDEYENLLKTNVDNDEIEFLNYKLNELKDYNYTLEDEENIINEFKALNTYSQNANLFSEIINYLDGNDNNSSVNFSFYNALKQLNKLATNEKVNQYYEKFNEIYINFMDLTELFKKDFSNDNIDLNRLDYLENEITKINRLKRKYNTNNLLEYKNNLINKIEMINEKEIKLSKLKKLLDEKYDIAYKEAIKISQTRQDEATKLSKLVVKELNDLYINDASFSIHFTKTNELGSLGIDDAEFYMSANKGVNEMPLIKVASGGEVSRIMLGLKSVFSKLSMVDIIIFDEIDTGVSGKVALAMGQKMANIAKYAQVLAITHLPQVAAMSNHHYYIYKITENNKTKTIVKPLNNEEKELEVARLLSGNEITDNFIKAAKELISSK